MEQTTVKQRSRYEMQSGAKKTCILIVLTALFSFAGWVAETLLLLIQYGDFNDRGLLTLPFCPMYGLSMLLMYAIIRTPQAGLWNKMRAAPKTQTGRLFATVVSLLLYAVLAALLATLAEYGTGLFYNSRFGVRLWSYRKHDNNLHGYVCLKYSLLWGALATVVMGFAWYPMQNVLAKANTTFLAVAAVIFTVAITGDFLFNMIYLYKTGKRFLPFARILHAVFMARLC